MQNSVSMVVRQRGQAHDMQACNGGEAVGGRT